MTNEDFTKAISLISENHSNEIIINKTWNNKVPEKPTIHIKNCVASVIGKLISAGFSLSMREGLLQIDKY